MVSPPAASSSSAADSSRESKTRDEQASKKKKEQVEEMSDEEKRIKETIDTLVDILVEEQGSTQLESMKTLLEHVRNATASLTSVPLELKYLRKHNSRLRTLFDEWNQEALENKKYLADVLSLLATTYMLETRDCLSYKLQGNFMEIEKFGHEYIRHLAGEIGKEYSERMLSEESKPVDDLLEMADIIVPIQIRQHSEFEACDLLLEIEKLDRIKAFIDEHNFHRVCEYLLGCASYAPEPEDSEILTVCLDIYLSLQKYPEALRVALRLNDHDTIRQVFSSCSDRLTKKQLGFMLARQRFLIDVEDEELNEIISNTRLSEYFRQVVEELELTAVKTPEDVYKSHLVETRSSLVNVDSAKQNLASTIVNGFLNVGFGSDKLMSDSDAGDSWLYKNKDIGMTMAAASVGMIHMWDVYTGFAELDRYVESSDKYIRSGAFLGMGALLNGVRSSFDPAFNLITENMERASREVRISGALGLGLAYAGAMREDVAEFLNPIVLDTDEDLAVSAFAALALGLIFVGSCRESVAETILQTLLERTDEELSTHSASRFFSLALGLVFLGKQEHADAMIEATRALPEKISKYCEFTVSTCAYAGTGNVIKIQQLLQECGKHHDEETEMIQKIHQGVAVAGLSIVAMGERVGSSMILRSFDHLLQYGDVEVRRIIPIALGLISISNPQVNVMDTLSKLSHDNDHEISLNAILSLGLIGAGTNNSRIAGLLRQLSSYYQREPNHLFLVKISQGLIAMGKGTMTLNPYHSDRMLLSPVALAGLLVLVHATLDIKETLLSNYPQLFLFLSCAMYPRFLVTVDENLAVQKVSVRVGQAVDTVAAAGRPRSITGFQQHDTPVLMSDGDRAEIADESYEPISSILEGVIIVHQVHHDSSTSPSAS